MAAAKSNEQKELLALMHQHLVQIGYGKAARELLLQSGQKTFPLSPIPLREIFTHWKKTSSPAQKQKADDAKRETPAKIRVPDPKSSSESEEEAAKPITTCLPANNTSIATAESSSDDDDSSSEEDTVAGKMVKTAGPGNKTATFLQLAAQKSNSIPGKGVAVASVQSKGKLNTTISNKPSPSAVAKAVQNKVIPGKPGALIPAGQSIAQTAAAKKAVDSGGSGSSSSSSDSEEEQTAAATVNTTSPKQAPKKAESSSEDSSGDSDSEEATNVATVQAKPAVPSAQVSATASKSSPATAVPSKGPVVKASPAKTAANQTRVGLGDATGSTKLADSSESSDSSDSEDEEASSGAQVKSSGRPLPSFTKLVKNASTPQLNKAVPVSTFLKQTPKPPVPGSGKQGLLSPAKSVGSAKRAESSESSESSESENEVLPVPVSQKRLQTPPRPTTAKQNQADKPGPPVKATSSALKGKEMRSESSSSSDSEDEMVPAAQNLPSPSATKKNATAPLACAKKPPPLPAPLQKAQESEDSSQDSSDESDSEEDHALAQKPAHVAQKSAPLPVKAPALKAGSSKAGVAPSAGKGAAASPAKLPSAALQKAPESSETDSSESEEDGKPAKQPPIHPFFKQKTTSGKAASASGNSLQANSAVSNATVNKRQGRSLATTPGVVKPSPSKKARLSQSQALPAKPAGSLKSKESSGSSSSSDSEQEGAAAPMAAQKIPQSGMLQKPGAAKGAESSSEESSDEDQEPSQSLLSGYPSPFKTPLSATPKTAASPLAKWSSGKAVSAGALLAGVPAAKSSVKVAPADSSSSDSSDSDTDDKETSIKPKAELGSLPSPGKEAVTAKGAVAGKAGPRSLGLKASAAKKALAKTQSNGKDRVAAAIQPLLPAVQPEGVSSGSESEEAVAQGHAQATSAVPAKAPKATKPSKAGKKEKQPKKRKLAPGDAGPGERKGKKRKVQSDLELLEKKKKKSKSSSSTKSPKKKDGKEKKSDKKKKKSKKLELLASDGSQKKKKKKKTGDLEGAA
ncbi:treacle protein isoform X2 [Hemicordylus capensis]|uniref:treacle protein isoform X2 n=1 Tax=Hemicordylus capensis TaxID=884348 RepID=UPI00230413F6|nr:treacle protein isoform X2 [Hemicordylus capensis]